LKKFFLISIFQIFLFKALPDLYAASQMEKRGAGKEQKVLNKDKETKKGEQNKKKIEAKGPVVKRRGFDWMGVPFLKFRSDFGIGGGAKVSLFDYGDGTHKPFKYNLQLQYFATSLGKKDHVLFLIAPNFMGAGVDFDIELRYQSLDNSKFFGIGNDSSYNENFETSGADGFKSKRYYEYKRLKPRFVLNVLKKINSKISILSGFGVQKTTIKNDYPDENADMSTLRELSPYGVEGGYTNFIKIGIVYDTRNFIASPETGIWSEFTIERADKILGSDYEYNRYTITDRRFYRIIPRLVLAQRIIFEWMAGKPPFYEYSFIGGSATLMEAMGGNKSLRGYQQNRFIDEAKLISNTELRYLLATRFYGKGMERIDVYPVSFFDAGRVYSKPSDFTLKYLRFTSGGGIRVAWNRFFVGRLDVGFSREGYVLNIGFANIF